ncbi:hypothetical protein U8V72_18190 [Priestia filamentosa]|uniref:hypothetical protein n=1 Tax=Priestia filamentosa TaxID=1402861 RepID=UPI0039789FCC
MTTIIQKGKLLKKQFILTTPKRKMRMKNKEEATAKENLKQNEVFYNTPRKKLMKYLFISDLSLENVKGNETKKTYTFSCSILKMTFKIIENLITGEKKLYQDTYLLEDNTFSCNALLQKLVL